MNTTTTISTTNNTTYKLTLLSLWFKWKKVIIINEINSFSKVYKLTLNNSFYFFSDLVYMLFATLISSIETPYFNSLLTKIYIKLSFEFFFSFC